jgi:transposase-like protein
VATLTLPFDARYTRRCPYCESLGTEWHPATRSGRCHTCGKSWVLERPTGRPEMAVPEHTDLIDDCLVALRGRKSYRETFAAYDRAGVPGVTPERFARAWSEAKSLAS